VEIDTLEEYEDWKKKDINNSIHAKEIEFVKDFL